MKNVLNILIVLLALTNSSAWSATCKADMSYLLNEFLYSGIHQPVDIQAKVLRTGRAKAPNQGFFQSVYELEIDRLFPLPINRINNFAYDKEKSLIRTHGFNLENAIEVVIMPDNSLQIVEGKHLVHILLEMGDRYIPTRVTYWKYLPANRRDVLADALKSESELDFINRFDVDLKAIVAKKEFGEAVDSEEEVLYRAYLKEWKKHQQLVEILGHRDVQELHQLNDPKQLEEIIARVPKKTTMQANQAIAPESVKRQKAGDASLIKIDSETELTDQMRRDFYQQIADHRQKMQAESALATKNSERAKQIAELNGNKVLIATFEKLERMKGDVNFNDFKAYAASFRMQAAVKIAMDGFPAADLEVAEDLFANLIMLMRKRITQKEDFLVRIMDKSSEEQEKIIAMMAVNKFAEFIKSVE